MAEPILIWGAGAVGGTIGAYWARAGVDVLLVDTDGDHVHACRNIGLTIEGPVDSFSAVVPAVTPNELHGFFSRIVLAVKAHHTPDAMNVMAPHITEDGFVLSAQNGLNEIIIAEHVGVRRTMGAFINFGADVLAPGTILFGNRGAVVVGEIDGKTSPRTKAMHELLQLFEPDAVLTDNIWGFLWGKLAYGAMLFATALNMDSMAENFEDPERLPVWIALGREVMSVAHAQNVRTLGFNGFDPEAFADVTDAARARESVAQLAEFNRHTMKTHSGVWRD
jgi:2-dehydropantoate 2-reductase